MRIRTYLTVTLEFNDISHQEWSEIKAIIERNAHTPGFSSFSSHDGGQAYYSGSLSQKGLDEVDQYVTGKWKGGNFQ